MRHRRMPLRFQLDILVEIFVSAKRNPASRAGFLANRKSVKVLTDSQRWLTRVKLACLIQDTGIG